MPYFGIGLVLRSLELSLGQAKQVHLQITALHDRLLAPPTGVWLEIKLRESNPIHTQGFQPPEAEDPDPEKATQCKRQGDKAFSDKDFPGAEQLYTNALRHDTSNHLLWANRSAARLRQGKNDEALQDARTSRQINPKYLKASPPLTPFGPPSLFPLHTPLIHL